MAFTFAFVSFLISWTYDSLVKKSKIFSVGAVIENPYTSTNSKLKCEKLNMEKVIGTHREKIQADKGWPAHIHWRAAGESCQCMAKSRAMTFLIRAKGLLYQGFKYSVRPVTDQARLKTDLTLHRARHLNDHIA